MKKPRIAVFDLTDCEGCELQFLALREKLAEVGHDFEIENWRLITSVQNPGPFDVTFIEGSPISEEDIEVVKRARNVSEKIITLGTCAVLGGIQASADFNRAKAIEEIYGKRYKSKSKNPKPVEYYIEVDLALPGCPVNPNELEKLLSCLVTGQKFIPSYAPVCLDCKIKENGCLFVSDGFCLGPVTKGGCGAPCPAAGLRCYGCFGPLPGANVKALSKAAPHLKDEELDQALRLFMKSSVEYQEFKLGGRKSPSTKVTEDK